MLNQQIILTGPEIVLGGAGRLQDVEGGKKTLV